MTVVRGRLWNGLFEGGRLSGDALAYLLEGFRLQELVTGTVARPWMI